MGHILGLLALGGMVLLSGCERREAPAQSSTSNNNRQNNTTPQKNPAAKENQSKSSKDSVTVPGNSDTTSDGDVSKLANDAPSDKSYDVKVSFGDIRTA